MSMQNRVMFVSSEVNKFEYEEYSDVLYSHSLMNSGRVTVLDRMTGFGYRDIETGYRSPCGGFWLASGGYDVRDHLAEFADEDAMIEWIIARANTCAGTGERTRYVRPQPERKP